MAVIFHDIFCIIRAELHPSSAVISWLAVLVFLWCLCALLGTLYVCHMLLRGWTLPHPNPVLIVERLSIMGRVSR